MRYTTIGRRGHGSFLRPRGAAVISLAAVGLVLAACSSGGSSTESSSGAPAPSSSGAAPTSEAPAEPVELWVQSGNGGADALLAGYEELNAAFEAANPGVTIKFEVKSFTELVDTLSLQLSGDGADSFVEYVPASQATQLPTSYMLSPVWYVPGPHAFINSFAQ